MNKKTVYLFLFNGYSDWEISYVTPELSKSTQYQLKTFSTDGKPVISAGGLRVQPDLSLEEVTVENMAMLVLPGGEAWE
jgi:transcriptional regulator GlxA family with amidase domain